MKPSWWLASAILISMAAAVYWAWSSHESPISKVGLIGSLASIWGIVLAWLQGRDALRIAAKAQDASDAAKAASEAAARRFRNMYYRDSLYTARRLLAEIRTSLESRNWHYAAGRAIDLGEQCSRLAHSRPQTDDEWLYVTTALAAWAIIFREGKQLRSLTFPQDQWADLYIFMHEKIEREMGPFGEE